MTEAKTIKKTVKKAPALKKPAAKKLISKEPNKAGFAIFATGGKQYRVKEGDLVKIEKIQGEHGIGDKVTFDTVLFIDNAGEVTVGTPFIKGAEVSATINKIGRYKTIDVIKYKQKSRYFKKYGHRQPYFEIKIEGIK